MVDLIVLNNIRVFAGRSTWKALILRIFSGDTFYTRSFVLVLVLFFTLLSFLLFSLFLFDLLLFLFQLLLFFFLEFLIFFLFFFLAGLRDAINCFVEVELVGLESAYGFAF